MSRVAVVKQLNFARELHPPSTIGRRFGPDMQGRVYEAVEVVPRPDGRPGSTLVLEHDTEHSL